MVYECQWMVDAICLHVGGVHMCGKARDLGMAWFMNPTPSRNVARFVSGCTQLRDTLPDLQMHFREAAAILE